MHRIFPSAAFLYDGLYRQRGSLYLACGAVEVCEVYCGVFFYHIGIFSLSYDTETSGDDHAGIYHAKDNPSVAGAGVFDHDLGGVFWKIDLCVLCGFVVFAVQRAGDGLAGTELVCVGIFCGGDFLFCAV